MNLAAVARDTAAPNATTRWLADNLGASWLRVLDVRWAGQRSDASGPKLRDSDDTPRFVELGPRAGWFRAGHWPARAETPRLFLEGHVPGATSFDVGRRLFDETGSLISVPELAMTMSEAGIGDEHTVVVVDGHAPAAGLVVVWALRRYGHDARLLGGGFPRWLAEGRPVTREVVRHPFASFTARRTS